MLLLLAMLAQTLVAPTPRRLQLSAEPSPVPPGAQATVRVRAAPGATLRLFANAGEFGPALEVEPGVFRAAYHPPDDGIPRVAILWAQSGQGEAGWLALPIWAAADATLNGRPRALVAMTVGPNRFGPVRADAAGRATLEVLVPPGVNEARSGTRRILLHVPESATLAVFAARERMRADLEQRIEVALYAITPEGLPRTDGSFELEVHRGSVSAPERVAPGEYRAIWSLPPGIAGVETLEAALSDRPMLRHAMRITLEPGPASSIAFEPGPHPLVAGEAGGPIRVLSRDRAGNGSTQPLNFETSFGEVAAEPIAPGDWSLRLRMPSRIEGRTTVRLVARGDTQAELELPLSPAAPARAEITAAGTTFADGQSQVEVRLAVSDGYGNTVRSIRPVLSAAPGTVSAVAERDSGWVATYRPPLLRERGSAAIVAQVGGARAEARIELVPPQPLLVLSPKLGLLSNFADLTSPLLGVEAALQTDRLGPRLEVLGELSWSFSSLSDSPAPTPGFTVPVRSHTDYVTAALAAGAFFSIDERTRVFLNLGPTLTRVSSSLRIGTQPTSFGATLVPGAQLSVGLERRMWRSLPFIEARWSMSADPALEVLNGSARSLALNAGARFGLF